MKSRSTSSATQQQLDDKPLVVFMIRDAIIWWPTYGTSRSRGLMRNILGLHLMGLGFKTYATHLLSFVFSSVPADNTLLWNFVRTRINQVKWRHISEERNLHVQRYHFSKITLLQ